MGSIRKPELLMKPVKLTATTLRLPSGSTLNIGAMQYNLTANLDLNTAVTGVGGLDASAAAGQLYYVYAVYSGGNVYLIGSTNSSLPSGFTLARQVGGFTTNASSQIDQVGEYPGNLAVAGSVSAGGGVAVEDTSNFIINGGFDFWQRGTSGAAASYTTGVYVAADRWKAASLMQLVGAGGMSIVKDTSTPSSNSGASLKFNLTDARVDVCGVGQYIESQNCLPLIGKTCTISFWVKRISSGLNAYPMTAYVSYLNTKDTPSTSILDGGLTTQISSYVVATSMQSLSTSFVKYSMTFSVPSGASNGILFRICLGNGLGDIASATGDLLSIGEVMLNIGTSAAPFKRAGGTAGGELTLCQRYFHMIPNAAGSANDGSVIVVGYSDNANNFVGEYYLPTTMRTTPAVSAPNIAGALEHAYADATVAVVNANVISSAYTSYNSPNRVLILATGSTKTGGVGSHLRYAGGGDSVPACISVDAEL
jgi:hypothetical protein